MKIWKYTLEVTYLQQLKMPRNAKILSVQTQGGAPQLWALVDESAEKEPRHFATYGTGNSLPERADGFGEFVGTYQLQGGALVFHVFEVTK